MRLIDADELIYMVLGEDTDEPFRFVPTEFIENAPVIDAEPVIRCKDCMYWKEHKPTERRFCELVTTPTKSYWLSRADDFCSRGERKEDEQV